MHFLINTYKTTPRCADPRDKIFALIGLLKPDDEFRVVFPDYSLTHGEIILKALAIIRQQHDSRLGQNFMKHCCRMLLDIFLGNHDPDWVPWIMQRLAEHDLHPHDLRLGDAYKFLEYSHSLLYLYLVAFMPPCHCELEYRCRRHAHGRRDEADVLATIQ